MILEPTERPWPRWVDGAGGFNRQVTTNALVAWLFAITGPFAILLTVAEKAQFSRQDTASWICGAYAVGGAFAMLMSYLYRQPIGMAWTIPGALLVGPAFEHLNFSEVIGAYFGAGILIVLLGITGWARKVMALTPIPIVMGMVCGVLLPFGLKVVTGFQDSFWIAMPIAGAYFLASAVPAVGRVIPPMLAALVVGIAAVVLSGGAAAIGPMRFELLQPKLVEPVFSMRAFFELAIPLMVTVVGIHNPQGIAVLASSGYKPPINALTVACGIGSLMAAAVGSVSTCVTGPSNAIMCSSGRKDQRFVAGMLYGLLMLLFGLAAPMVVTLGMILPGTFIGVLGGLAIVRVLQAWMTAAFASQLSFGALTAFLITLSGANILHIGAPFWALALGVMVSWLMERPELRKIWEAR